MKCIVGLGNPGKKYEQTRHNIGFLVIDELARRHHEQLAQEKFKCAYTSINLSGEKVLLVKPQTFMNLSGEGVRPLADYLNIDPSDIAVIFDDLDLPTGKIRLRMTGGHGGHNGIRSLITHLDTKAFNRIRVGIGRPIQQMTVVDYVLQRFQKEEMNTINDAIQNAADAIEAYLETDFNQAMNQFNQA